MKMILKRLTILLCLISVGKQVYSELVTVAQDGTGDFKSIQAAINATKDNSPDRLIIHIKEGTYKEKLAISSSKTNISLIGQDKFKTIISWDDYSGKTLPGADPIVGPFHTTSTSYTVQVKGSGFQASELTIENSAGPVGQAVALHVDADKVMIHNCRLLGYQDTLYTGSPGAKFSRQYYKECYIEGGTDFIFGNGAVLFDECTIKSVNNAYITAAATTQNQTFGYVFRNCELTANANATKVYLGRPWRPYAKTVFLNTKMGAHILPEGWNNWDNPANEATVYYAEYNTTGVDVTERVSWSKQLIEEDVEKYTINNIFSFNDGVWVPGIVDELTFNE